MEKDEKLKSEKLIDAKEILEAQQEERERKQEKDLLKLRAIQERGLSYPYDLLTDDF